MIVFVSFPCDITLWQQFSSVLRKWEFSLRTFSQPRKSNAQNHKKIEDKMRLLVCSIIFVLIIALAAAELPNNAAAKKQFAQVRVMKRRAYHAVLKFLSYLKEKYAAMPIDTAYCLNGIMHVTKGKFPTLFAEAKSLRDKDAEVQKTSFPDQFKMFATLMMQEQYVTPWKVAQEILLPAAQKLDPTAKQMEFNEKLSDQCITSVLSCNVNFDDQKHNCFYKYLTTNTTDYITTHQVCVCFCLLQNYFLTRFFLKKKAFVFLLYAQKLPRV